MGKFVHLHLHSHYSLLDGLAKIDQILDRCLQLGMSACALTDHGALYGAVEFFKKAKARNIKPIIGCELYVAFEKMEHKRPRIDDKKYHLVALIKNEVGYHNLVKLITKAYLEGFYYKPRVDEDLLREYGEGLIFLSACLQGKIPQLILERKFREAEKLALYYQSIFGKENFYLEIQDHPNIADQKIVNKALIEISKRNNIPLVATNDCHYVLPEDAEAQDILMLINTSADPNDPERLTMKADDFSIKSAEQMISAFKDVPGAIENTERIAQICNFEFKFHTTNLPYFEAPGNKDPFEYLKELCEEGLKKRFPSKIPNEVRERLEYELEIIKKSGFSSYFLIVQDFVRWAKEQRIVVGPGRGSVGGSLVAYLLEITNIDPIKFNLFFERFLNPERISPPDIDIDFADRRRDEVIEYARKKYGKEMVAQIITFGTMAARAVVRDVGRALGYPYSLCDKIAKLIPQGYSLDETLARVSEFRQLYESDPKIERLIDFAKKLEGCVRHVSTHACGVVISNTPLDEIVPLQHPTQDDSAIVTQYEMTTLEELGLLKMDFLGLENLTLIEETLKKIYAIHKVNIEIEKIPLDDKRTFKLFQGGETIGVFQFESEGMRKWLKKLKPTTFEDLIAMIALYRPGPMQFIQTYIDRKHKKEKITYLHPKLEPLLKETYGIPIYQEQIMQIARELAGFSLGEADILRKAIGKKIRELLDQQYSKFVRGMKENNISEELAEKIWNWILPFASYGFNKSHSVAYAHIAYQTAYLKAHYPVEFMSSLLSTKKSDPERVGFLIQECKRMGIEVLPPDINESFREFSVVPGKNQIRFGLLAIKNVGTNTVDAILKERKERGPFQSLSDFLSRMEPKEINKRSLESLIKAGVFDKFEERRKLLENIEILLEWNKSVTNKKSLPQMDLFGKRNSMEIQLKPTKPATKKEKLIWEKELLGLYVSSHPAEDFKHLFLKNSLPISKISNSMVGKIVRVGGIITGIKKIISRNGSPMYFTQVEDGEGQIELVVFPSILMKNPDVFQEHKAIYAIGKVDDKDGVPKIICEDVEEIVDG